MRWDKLWQNRMFSHYQMLLQILSLSKFSSHSRFVTLEEASIIETSKSFESRKAGEQLTPHG